MASVANHSRVQSGYIFRCCPTYKTHIKCFPGLLGPALIPVTVTVVAKSNPSDGENAIRITSKSADIKYHCCFGEWFALLPLSRVACRGYVPKLAAAPCGARQCVQVLEAPCVGSRFAFAVPSASRGHTSYQCYPFQIWFHEMRRELYGACLLSSYCRQFPRETNAKEGKSLTAETITTYSKSIPAELGFGFKLHCVRMQLYRWRFRRVPIS